MARRKAKVGPTQRLLGYGILAVLGLIVVWLGIQQSRFNPAVTVASRAPLLSALSQASSPGATAVTATLIPAIKGFTPVGALESYGPENLSDKIDGRAELYLSAGFKEMSCRSFTLAGGAHVEVFVYDMGDAANSFAVFSNQRRPGAESLPLATHAYATANALFFSQGRFYVEIVADRDAAGFKDELGSVAKALLAKMPQEGEAAGDAGLLPKEGLVPDSVRLNAADVFGLEGFNQVFTGEYNLKTGKATAFLAKRGSPQEAQKEAQRYLDFLAANGYHQVLKPGSPEGVTMMSLEDSVEVIMLEGRFLAGVHDASSPEAAQELAAKLRAALKGKS